MTPASWRLRSGTTDQLEVARERLALADLLELPLQRVPHLRVIERRWDLRQQPHRVRRHVALAELLNLVRLTGHLGLATAPGLRCSVEVVS